MPSDKPINAMGEAVEPSSIHEIRPRARSRRFCKPANWLTWQSGLVIGFFCIIGFMILLTTIGFYQMGQNEQRLDRIVNNHLVKLERSTTMQQYARERTLNLQHMLLSDEPFERDEKLMEIDRFGSRFIQARLALLGMELSDAERELLEQQGHLTAATVPLQRRVLALIEEDRVDEATELLTEEAIPAQDAVQSVLNEFKELQRTAAQTAVAEASALQAKARTLTLAVSVLVVLLSLLVAGLVIHRVRRATSEREHLATHDALTGLPNRILLMDRLQRELSHNRRTGLKSGVLFIDMDGFKVVNDTLGHAVGDELLIQFSTRLCECVRESDTVARLGGDEFVVLLSEAESAQVIALVAERILTCFAEPFRLTCAEVFSGASIGISIYPDQGERPDELLKHADIALYAAKEAGRGTYRFYAQAMGSKAQDRLNLETALRRAAERDEFVLFYQPIVSSSSGKIVSVEALLRWQHPEFGLVSPASFIPLLEETGLIVPVGNWVMKTAAAQLHEWQALDGHGQLRVSINLSMRQFDNGDLASQVLWHLEKHKLPVGTFEIELTESLLMRSNAEASDMLQRLADTGVLLAIDDFGIGYSSLGRLRQLTIHRLKIDQSFVSDMVENSNDRAIVHAVIAMARSLDLQVVAEGVETVEQLRELQCFGDIELQGYLFSRPLAASEMRELLTQSAPFPQFSSTQSLLKPTGVY